MLLGLCTIRVLLLNYGLFSVLCNYPTRSNSGFNSLLAKCPLWYLLSAFHINLYAMVNSNMCIFFHSRILKSGFIVELS